MSDIFISYKREDRPRAKLIGEKLEEKGFSVWWDRNIPPGRSFDEVIQEALDAAACVMVLWSELSVKSSWVKEEAEVGKQRGLLVPILIDDVPIPLGFGRIQTANLVDWQGDTSDSEFRRLLGSIGQMFGQGTKTFALVRELLLDQDPQAEAKPSAAEPGPVAERPERPRFRLALWAAAMAAVSVSAGAGFYYVQPDLLSRASGATAADATAAPVTVDSGIAPSEVESGVDLPDAGEAVAERHDLPTVEDETATLREPQESELAAETQAEEATRPEEAVSQTAEVTTEPTPAGEPQEAQPQESASADPALSAYKNLSELQTRSQETGTDQAELLSGYRQLWSEYRTHLDADAALTVLKTIESLEAAVASADDLEDRVAEAEKLDQRDDLTVLARLAHWRDLAVEAADGPAAERSAARIEELEKIVESSATITAEDRFVTCREVARGEGTPTAPIDVAEAFRPGTVWVFAWVSSPRSSETLSLQWMSEDGTVERAQKVKVSRNTAGGYRIFYGRQHAAPGRYEVRLINQAGDLIGRRAFTVG